MSCNSHEYVGPPGPFGLHLHDGTVLRFERRSDLRYSPQAQRLLGTAHRRPSEAMHDHCCPGLKPIRCFPVIQDDGTLGIRVEDAGLPHAPGCPVDLGVGPIHNCYDPDYLFSGPSTPQEAQPWWAESAASCGPRTLSELFGRTLSLASARSFVIANPELDLLRATRMPRIDEFLREVTEALRWLRLASGRSLIEEAPSRGLELAWGVIIDDVAHRLVGMTPGTCLVLRPAQFHTGAGDVTGNSLRLDWVQFPHVFGRIRAMKGWHRGPYVFLALGRWRQGVFKIDRIHLHPAVIRDGVIVLAESTIEQRYLFEEMVRRAVWKPQCLSETNWLFATVLAREGRPSLVLERRPDCIFFEEHGISIREIKGFRNWEPYLADFVGKPGYYAGLRAPFAVRYEGEF